MWRTVLEASDDPELLRRLGLVMAMPSEIRSRVEAIPGVNSELVLRELPTVEMSMQLNLYHKVAKFKEVVTDKTLYGVELMAEELYRVSYEPVVDPNELTDLHQQVRDLFDDVADATIDARLKDVLSHHLRAMDSAIQEVRIRGASGLRDVADMSLGAIIVVAHSEEVQRDEKRRSLCARVLAVALALGSLAGGVNAGFQLSENIMGALGDGSASTSAQPPDPAGTTQP